MIVRPVLLTQFSQEVFGKLDYQSFGKRYPHLLYLGFEVQDADISGLIARGPVSQTTTPSGVVVSASYQIWKSILPELLADRTTAKLAAQINIFLAKAGLSCR